MTRVAGASRWWSRGRGLPDAVHQSWRSSAADGGGRAPRMLAWARTTDDRYAIGAPERFSVGDASGWEHLGWHEIEHGGWNAELRTLSWTRLDRRRGSVGLVDPGRVPELFRERIAATIALERFVPVAGERGVIITARRDLGSNDLSWHRSLTRGLAWTSPGVNEVAEEAEAELRSEYDLT